MEPVEPTAIDEEHRLGAVDGELVGDRAVVQRERGDRRTAGRTRADDNALVVALLGAAHGEDLSDFGTEDEAPQVEVVDRAVHKRATADLPLRFPLDLLVEHWIGKGAAER